MANLVHREDVIPKQGVKNMSWIAIPSLVSFLLCLGLALFIFSRNPKHVVNWSFALGMLSLAIMEFGHFLVLVSSELDHILLWKRVALIGECLIPGNWLLFSLTFSRSNYQEFITKWKWFIVPVYLISLTFLVFIGSDRFIWVSPSQSSSDFLFLGRIGYYFYIFFLLTAVAILLNLETTFRASTTVARWRIKYAILGVGALFAFFIYLISQPLLFLVLKPDFLPTTSVIILISIAMITFSLIRHRLLDVDVFVSRQVVYRSLTVFLVGIYLLTVGLLGHLVKYVGGEMNFFFTILLTFLSTLVLLIFLLSEEIRRKVKFYINKHFYKNKYDYREKWLECTEDLSSKLSLNDLLPAIIELLAKTVWVKRISIWLYQESRDEFYLAKAMNIEETDMKIKGDNSLISYFKEKRSPINTEELEKDPRLSPIYEENKEFFEKMSTCLCVPLIIGGKIIGLMTLSEELTDGAYSYEDYELLKNIASQASSLILVAQLSQELVTTKQMETFHRLSTFIIHDIKNFISMLSLVVQNATSELMKNPEFQQDILKMMSDLVSKMQALITKLSTIPDKLELDIKEVDINQLIEETISTFLLNSYRKVTVLKDLNVVPKVNLDYTQIQKVLMNLLLNAAAAVEEKGEIRVGTSYEDDWVKISISDNGYGMSREFIENSLFKPFRTTKKNGLGIGLFQCKTILEALQGKIEVESEEGIGSTFKIFLKS